MSNKIKKSLPTSYKRGKTRIKGDSPTAKRMMFIDLVTSKLFWIALFIASIYLEHKTSVISNVIDLLARLIRGHPVSR